MQPRLSICIATLNRGAFIGETLDTIVSQLRDDVELLIVDGASKDNTGEIVGKYAAADPRVRYVRLPVNSGVDRDYDIAVSHAQGEFCWLMTDDDLLKPGAIDRVVEALGDDVDLVVVNTEVRTVDFGGALRDTLVAAGADSTYAPEDADSLLVDAAHALSFIGCVVIRRSFWLARDRAAYYGSLFIHVGVIFQAQTPRTRVIAAPMITIRYGNAMWTPRGFEIWMFKWPSLVWSFDSVSSKAKARISAREPWRQLRKLWLYRSIGGYARDEYDRYLAERPMSAFKRVVSRAIAVVPATFANGMSSLYCGLFARHARMNIYDLSRSPHATFVSRAVARSAGY
ncbi:glycosyltransferase [Lysobacter sp. A6]|uniref:Glycosyltransferase n=1 Tax=Noviluteimonas lactosilytica TaxID=2888523 RepID=A0ABS8JFW7_9GAMM|nr:glycosyltransferase family 2 protein [Lysobacter lactosilyticus]MCC8362502.1 glycosyltransferase [Lysobacter lactosilyticus]